MNFKDWILTLEDYGYDWSADLETQRDPFLFHRIGYPNLIRKGAEGIAQGFGSQFRKEAEKTGAKAGSIGQIGYMPTNFYDPLRRRGNLAWIQVYVPANEVEFNGKFDTAKFRTVAKNAAWRGIAKQLYNSENEILQAQSQWQMYEPKYVGRDMRGFYRASVQFMLSPYAQLGRLNPANMAQPSP